MSNPISVRTNEGLLIKNIIIKGGRFAEFCKKSFGEAIQKHFPKAFEMQILQTCHTLEDLRKMDHPYAARHFGGSKTPPQETIPEEGRIHVHHGDLFADVRDTLQIDYDAKESVESASQMKTVFKVELFKPSPVTIYVFQGTSKDGKNIMVARNPGWLASKLAMPYIEETFFQKVKASGRKAFERL